MLTRILASVAGLVAVGLGLLIAPKITGKQWNELDSKQRDRVLLFVLLFVAVPAMGTVVALSLTGVI